MGIKQAPVIKGGIYRLNLLLHRRKGMHESSSGKEKSNLSETWLCHWLAVSSGQKEQLAGGLGFLGCKTRILEPAFLG